MTNFFKSTVFLSLGVISSFVCNYLYKLYKSKNTNAYKFMRFDGELCQRCFNERTPNLCGNETCSYGLLRFIIKKIEEARSSIDICNPCIELPELATSLVAALKRNVQVRIIVDQVFRSPPTEINFLAVGIPVKILGLPPESLMHNKFLIIDRKLAIRGSLNYTIQSLKGNCENLQFILDAKQVDRYCQYFEKMFDQNCDIHAISEN